MKLEEFLTLDDKLEITLWQDVTQADGTDFSYRSSILDIQNSQILVYFPSEDSAAFDWVEQGQKVRIVVTRSNGLWSFFPTVGQFSLKGAAKFWLKLPDDVEHLQRRTHVRVKHTFPLQIQLETDALIPPNDKVATSVKPLQATSPLQVVDVSAGGIRFKTETPLTAGQLVTASFKLTPAMSLITTRAKVAYCFNPDELPASSSTSAYALKVPSKALGAKKEYIAAISFIDLPRELEKRIIQECFHLELEQHRKGVR